MTDAERRTVYRVRREFERHRAPVRMLMRLYDAYCPVPDKRAFIAAALRQFPKLNCGIATVYLRHRLGRGAIINGSYRGSGHTFLALGRLIVDITADQFGGPPVYIGPLVPPWSRTSVR